MNILAVLTQAGICPTNGEARRMVHQKAVRVNEKLINDTEHKLKDGVYTITVGRKLSRRVQILDGRMVYPSRDMRDEKEFRDTERMMGGPAYERRRGAIRQKRY